MRSFYETVQDFIPGIIVDEVANAKIFASLIDSHQYCAQLHNIASYDQVR